MNEFMRKYAVQIKGMLSRFDRVRFKGTLCALCQRKCLHVYHYQLHPELGCMYVRLQTWFLFTRWVVRPSYSYEFAARNG